MPEKKKDKAYDEVDDLDLPVPAELPVKVNRKY